MNLWSNIISSVAALATVFLLAAPLTAAPPKSQKLWVYIGTFAGGKGQGVYRAELDLVTGKLSEPVLAAKTERPGFVAIHPSGRFLYAVNGVAKFQGMKTGAVSAFGLDPKTGALTFLNQQTSSGLGPCHIVVDAKGNHVLLANYSGGSASAIAVNKNGKLGKVTAFVQHRGKSVDPKRQTAPHAHSINMGPNNRFAFVADLGLDKVLIYKFDETKGTLTANDPPAANVKPGAGPRHFTFHPSGKYAYVINEMQNTVDAMRFDAKTGALTVVQTIPTLPKGFQGTSYTAEVLAHPSGKFLYGSNRGHNSISVFRIDGRNGKLTLVGHQGEGIKTPRNFRLDPTGQFLLVANQDSDSIIVFRIDAKTGELTPTGSVVSVPRPVCIRMLAKPGQ